MACGHDTLFKQIYFTENRVIGGLIMMDIIMGSTVLIVIIFFSYEAYLSTLEKP